MFPHFWRLHGWIDDRIDDWFAAHEQLHPGEVVRQPHGAVNWFKPGRWVQVAEPWVWPEALANGHHVDPDLRQRRITSMENLVAILTSEEAISEEMAVAEATGALVSLDLLLKAPV